MPCKVFLGVGCERIYPISILNPSSSLVVLIFASIGRKVQINLRNRWTRTPKTHTDDDLLLFYELDFNYVVATYATLLFADDSYGGFHVTG